MSTEKPEIPPRNRAKRCRAGGAGFKPERDVRFINFPSFCSDTRHTVTPPSASSCLTPMSEWAPAVRGAPYLGAGPFPDKISALWSRASSRPSSLLPRRFFPLSKLCYTLLSWCLTWKSLTSKRKKANTRKRRAQADISKDTELVKLTYLSTWKSCVWIPASDWNKWTNCVKRAPSCDCSLRHNNVNNTRLFMEAPLYVHTKI